MRDTEVKAKLNMDDMPLAALHKVSTHTHTHTQASSDSSLARREKRGERKINTRTMKNRNR